MSFLRFLNRRPSTVVPFDMISAQERQQKLNEFKAIPPNGKLNWLEKNLHRITDEHFVQQLEKELTDEQKFDFKIMLEERRKEKEMKDGKIERILNAYENNSRHAQSIALNLFQIASNNNVANNNRENDVANDTPVNH